MRNFLIAWAVGLALITGCSDADSESGPQAPARTYRPRLIGNSNAVSPTHPFEVAGRIVDRRGEGWPEEEVALRLIVGDDRWEQIVGPDGVFSFGLRTKPQAGRLWIHPLRRGWRWMYEKDGQGLQLTPEQIDGTEPIVLEIAERRRGRVHGIAIDCTSGARLPHFPITISAARPGIDSEYAFGPVHVKTDAEGHFLIEDEVWGGRMRVRTPPGNPRATIELSDCLTVEDSNDAQWVIEFSAGPRVPITLREASGIDLSTLRAGIFNVNDQQHRFGAPLHNEGDETWMWPAASRRVDKLQATMVIGSDDGFLFGSSTLRVDREGTWLCDPVVFQATGRLALDIETQPLPSKDGSSHEPPQIWPIVQITALDNDVIDPTWSFRSKAKRYFVPGNYSITVGARSHASVTRNFQIKAGEATALKVNLKLESEFRTLKALVRTQSGEPLHDFHATIGFRGPRPGTWYAEYHAGPGLTCGTGIDHYATILEDSNSSKATFQMDHIPLGDLRATAHCDEYACSVKLVEKPDGGLHLDVLVLDDPSATGFGFRWTELPEWPGMGIYLESTGLAGTGALSERAYNGRMVGTTDPNQQGFEWGAYIHDHVPIYGTEADFHDEGNGRFFAPLDFVKGWGIRVVVRDQAGEPIPNLIVLMDGKAQGTTNAKGHLDLSADEHPRQIELKTQDWAPVSGYYRYLPQESRITHKIVMRSAKSE